MIRAARNTSGSNERRERAERILEATAELLGAYGYKRVTVDDVAEKARVGKGTVYLHWKTREALFWAMLQREAIRLFEDIAAQLSEDPELSLPHRLMPAMYLELTKRPLVKAVLMSDSEVLGRLAEDETVRTAQRELGGNPNYLELVAEQGLLRPSLSPATAGYMLSCILSGFFLGEEHDEAGKPSLTERADMLADVVRRSFEPDQAPGPTAVASLSEAVVGMFSHMAAAHREQLEQAY
jgi:AcrR family transcriptional regulator